MNHTDNYLVLQSFNLTQEEDWTLRMTSAQYRIRKSALIKGAVET